MKVVVLAAVTCAAAVAGVPPALRGKDVESLPTRQRVVALTFDAGADSGHTRAILGTLRRDRVPATFFVTGAFARTYPRLTRVIARSYLLGNHSDTHPQLTRFSDSGVREQIERAERSIDAVTGLRPSYLFRFPYGDSDARTIAIANRLGYVCVRWTIDTLGWMTVSPATIQDRVLEGLRRGAIVLMHVASFSTDSVALPAVIAAVRARGYRFVTVAALEPSHRRSARAWVS